MAVFRGSRCMQLTRMCSILLLVVLLTLVSVLLLSPDAHAGIARFLAKTDDVSRGPPQASPSAFPATSQEEAIRRASIVAQYWRNVELETHPGNPLELQVWCNRDMDKFPERATYLVSLNGDEGTVARMKFTNRNREPKYNPNLLPYPRGSQYPYIGFARKSIKKVLYHHEVEYCDMEWAYTNAIQRKVLRCVKNKSVDLKVPEWSSPPGMCAAEHRFLELRSGLSDPRIFFTPRGEPLMIVGTNGQHNCLQQWVIDLRALIPDLGERMHIADVPVRFPKLTEMTTPNLHEVEKNYFLIHGPRPDMSDYIHHDYLERSISRLVPLEGSTWENMKFKNIAHPSPPLVTSLLRKYEDERNYANTLHQATNSLRVTLCDFPCIPTAHNTVIIEITHVKYKNVYELFYRRYVFVMNATAPFNIIGRTSNIMYAGTDEQTMLYTVSMMWDHPNFRGHEDWDEERHGGQEIWAALREAQRADEEELRSVQNEEDDEIEEMAEGPARTEAPDARLHRRRRRAAAAAAATATASVTPATTTTTTTTTTASTPPAFSRNPFVNRFYHGWLDDVLMINIGINDDDAAVLHTTARNLLSCMKTA
ncbi:uncharacterized protein V1518DRAFT_100881 [Limtongia smithiae]|uniref:uncharacterized protein n=1 Tax=Limtongia smithiae TaxID=1125753 RepID=UPI0034CEBFCB